MSSVRFRNGRYYYRATIKDHNGKRHWVEHGGFATYKEAKEAGEFAYPGKKYIQTTDHLADLIFERFAEKSTAFIPLNLLYYTDCTVRDAYYMKIDDLDLEKGEWKLKDKTIKLNKKLIKLLKKQIHNITSSRLIYLYSAKPIYVNCYLNTGKRVDHHQIYYVTKVIRRELNPMWSIKGFKSQTQHTS